MKPKIYNALAAIALCVLLIGAAVVLGGMLYIGSAFRMANVNQSAVFTVENFRHAFPLFGISAAILFGVLLGSALWALRKRG
ncbi:hypothetical protein [Luteimonas sp. MC1828]|uniref:hypothetical protein n=1 Tax=Luteimonas sp. MC1828 TaxID=2799787 RepID=UPI0018F26BB5|nr:hypothetical protein [Luteimonas sp. MC1828]MBJ7575473.1 hypothetical protein [Luteimonas sp. MC1828]